MLGRIISLRSHFKLVVPETISAVHKQIHKSNLSGKGLGNNAGSLFYLVGDFLSHSSGPVSMGELSHELEVPLSTATRTMDWLVRNGYARRLPDANDRRIVRVELTAKGTATYQANSTFMLAKIEQALSQLTPSERDAFISLLNKVLNAFEQKEGTSP